MDTLIQLGVFVALVLSSTAFIWGFYRPRMEWSAKGLLLLAFLLETLFLGHLAGMVRGFPAVTPGIWISFFVWMVAGAFLLWIRRAGWTPIGGFVTPVLTLIWLGGQLMGGTIAARLPARLTGPWLTFHIALATASYTAFLLASAAALMYIEKERELRLKSPRVFYYRLPSLAESDQWSCRMVGIGLPLLTAAMLVGGIWSKAVLGHYWTWTGKEIWSLVTWTVYVGYLVARWRGWTGHRAAWFSIWAFVLVVINFFGITVMFHGVHDYRG